MGEGMGISPPPSHPLLSVSLVVIVRLTPSPPLFSPGELNLKNNEFRSCFLFWSHLDKH